MRFGGGGGGRMIDHHLLFEWETLFPKLIPLPPYSPVSALLGRDTLWKAEAMGFTTALRKAASADIDVRPTSKRPSDSFDRRPSDHRLSSSSDRRIVLGIETMANPMMNFQPNLRNAMGAQGGNRTLSQHYLGGERGFQIISCEVSGTTVLLHSLRGGATPSFPAVHAPCSVCAVRTRASGPYHPLDQPLGILSHLASAASPSCPSPSGQVQSRILILSPLVSPLFRLKRASPSASSPTTPRASPTTRP